MTWKSLLKDGTNFGCRFDGVKFLRKYKGKKIMFVGDSLSLNQWQSLTCMLHAAVPGANFTMTTIGNISTFSFPVITHTFLCFTIIRFVRLDESC